jgi:hypothetical protein
MAEILGRDADRFSVGAQRIGGGAKGAEERDHGQAA